MSLQELTDQNFSQVLADSEVPVVVDFWAEWCQPCRKISPIVEKLSAEFGDRVKVVKVNADEAVDTCLAQSIRGLPTISVFKKGELVAQSVGMQTAANLREMIEDQL